MQKKEMDVPRQKVKARITRRSFLCLAMISSLAHPRQVRAQIQDGSISVVIRADDSARSKVFAPVALHNLDVSLDSSDDAKSLQEAAPKSRAVPIFYLIAGVIAVVLILEMIQELLRRREFGGVIIDMRKTPPLVSNDLKVPAELVFVVAPSGAVSQYTSENLSASALLNLLKGK